MAEKNRTSFMDVPKGAIQIVTPNILASPSLTCNGRRIILMPPLCIMRIHPTSSCYVNIFNLGYLYNPGICFTFWAVPWNSSMNLIISCSYIQFLILIIHVIKTFQTKNLFFRKFVSSITMNNSWSLNLFRLLLCIKKIDNPPFNEVYILGHISDKKIP